MGIMCPVTVSEIIGSFDKNFKILEPCSSDLNSLEDVYPLMVIHYEAKKNMMRILSLCELCKSVILRNYFGTISDYLYGDGFAGDDIFDYEIRTKYATHCLKANWVNAMKNCDFFIYWLSRYCLTDYDFMTYYAQAD